MLARAVFASRAALPRRVAALRTRMASAASPAEEEEEKSGERASDFFQMFFTCGQCDTRQVKAIRKQSYETGTVLVQCANAQCKAKHLIADHVGVFADRGTTLDTLAAAGDGAPVRRVLSEYDRVQLKELLGSDWEQRVNKGGVPAKGPRADGGDDDGGDGDGAK